MIRNMMMTMNMNIDDVVSYFENKMNVSFSSCVFSLHSAFRNVLLHPFWDVVNIVFGWTPMRPVKSELPTPVCPSSDNSDNLIDLIQHFQTHLPLVLLFYVLSFLF